MHSSWPGDNAPATVPAGPNGPDSSLKIYPYGRLLGLNNYPQWYPDWTPTTDWVQLPGVAQIQIQQSLAVAGGQAADGLGGGGGSNGIAVATVTCDNMAWTQVAGELGAYHTKQRGWLWPWRGFVPTGRPGGGVAQNQFYNQIPNAQFKVIQGYGANTVTTFTGLIDSIGPGTLRPDRVTLTGRDFGGILTDSNIFGWNKDTRLHDAKMAFIPEGYFKGTTKGSAIKSHNFINCKDVTDIVRCALRWSGFKEFQVEDAGVNLLKPYTTSSSMTWMDVINDVASQLGYVFFIAEPTSDDLSIGVPIFRGQSVLHSSNTYSVKPGTPTTVASSIPYSSARGGNPIQVDSTILTDDQPQMQNTNDRFIIRVRGRIASRKQGGVPIVGGDMSQDGQTMYTATYWPPWMSTMSGIIKQLTYYNIGQRNGILGFGSDQQCLVAAVLIAEQIALGRYVGTVQFPGNPAVGLDSMLYVNDAAVSGVTSRLYVTGRQSTMQLSGDSSGGSQGGSEYGPGSDNELLWSHQCSGSLVDNPEFDQVVNDYWRATTGQSVTTSGGWGQWS